MLSADYSHLRSPTHRTPVAPRQASEHTWCCFLRQCPFRGPGPQPLTCLPAPGPVGSGEVRGAGGQTAERTDSLPIIIAFLGTRALFIH